MEELMKTKIFKVTVERLLLNGGQTLYMVGWSLKQDEAAPQAQGEAGQPHAGCTCGGSGGCS